MQKLLLEFILDIKRRKIVNLNRRPQQNEKLKYCTKTMNTYTTKSQIELKRKTKTIKEEEKQTIL